MSFFLLFCAPSHSGRDCRQAGWVSGGHTRSNTNPEEILDLCLHSQIFRHNVEVELTMFNKQKLIYVSESMFLFQLNRFQHPPDPFLVGNLRVWLHCIATKDG